jgi:solute:Na+ symporter, SSS family
MSPLAFIVVTLVGIYLLIVIGIGIVGFRRLKVDVDDFYVVSRSLGAFVVFLTIAATYHSAFAVLTSTAVAAGEGVAWFVGSAVWTMLAALVSWFIGTRYWQLGKQFGYVTLADLISDFYQSVPIRAVIAVVMAIFVIPYIAVQSVAFGLMLDIGTEGFVTYEVGAGILSLVAVAYCVAAGQRGAAWTDVLQGIWMYVVVWLVGLVVMYNAVGSPSTLFAEVNEIDPALLTVTGEGFSHPLALFSSTMLFGVALVMGLQHIQMKFYAARDAGTIKLSSVWMAVYLSSIYIPPVLTGLTAVVLIDRGVLPPIEEIEAQYGTPDAVLPLIAVEFAPAILVGLLFAGAIAAAASTKDNFLLATAVVLTRDLYQKVLRPQASERQMVVLSRVVIVLFGLLGYYVALRRPGLIFDLVALSVAGVLQFAPAIVTVLFPSGRTRVWLTSAGATAGIVVGVAVTMMLTFPDWFGLGIDPNPLELHGGLWGLAANVVVGLVVSRFTPQPPEDAVLRIQRCLEEANYGPATPSAPGQRQE